MCQVVGLGLLFLGYLVLGADLAKAKLPERLLDLRDQRVG
jgi:hypothetical protein